MANEPRLPNGLTPKQFNFYNNIIEQMKTTGQMNPSQAAIDAGFAPKHVSKMASSLLKKPAGQAYRQGRGQAKQPCPRGCKQAPRARAKPTAPESSQPSTAPRATSQPTSKASKTTKKGSNPRRRATQTAPGARQHAPLRRMRSKGPAGSRGKESRGAHVGHLMFSECYLLAFAILW